jgi:hypothetical protein
MSLRKTITAAVAGTALVAANLGPFAAAARADSWGGGPRHGYHFKDHGKGGTRYSYNRYHRHKRDNIAKGIAIGLSVLLLGTILANANHHHDGYAGY